MLIKKHATSFPPNDDEVAHLFLTSLQTYFQAPLYRIPTLSEFQQDFPGNIE